VRGVTSPADRGASEAVTWRSVVAGPVVAVVTVLFALFATQAADVRFQDWEHAVARRLALMACVVAVLVVLDIVVRAAWRSRKLTPSRAAMRSVRRERWTLLRGVAVGSALVSFYVTYLAYRNLKSTVPLLRPGELFDGQLADYDRALFGGNDPAALLHTLLGTGMAAEVISVAYMAFFYFVLIALAFALVFARPRGGIFFVTALSINWGLGAGFYFLLPALGPIYAEAASFADLPATRVSQLQDVLLRQRLEFLGDPSAPGVHQGIGAFASLHTSIVFTAAIAAHMLRLDRRLRIGLWGLFALTTIATIYLGWHYVLDDVAGLVVAVLALVLARGLTGFKSRTARRLQIPRRAGLAERAAGAQSGQQVASNRPLEPSVAETTGGSDAA
jgi:membrane-associated phospholipid phosphatase